MLRLWCFQSIYSSSEVVQVNLAAQSGDMGVLANHVPAIEPLKPGIIEVIESAGQSKKWFGECFSSWAFRICPERLICGTYTASGGFANIVRHI